MKNNNLVSSAENSANSASREVRIKGWRYYKHAAVPTTKPHETPDRTPIENGTIWDMKSPSGKPPLMAVWTTDFDCAEETQFWYVIKDTPFDISSLKAKRRYEITSGNRNFFVQEFIPKDYGEEVFEIANEA